MSFYKKLFYLSIKGNKKTIWHLIDISDVYNWHISYVLPANTILTDYNHWAIICPLSPSLDHVHQLHQGVGGGRHLVALRPAHQLEQLAGLGRSLDTGHQLGERHDLLVDLEYPGSRPDRRLSRPVSGYITVLHNMNVPSRNKWLGITDTWAER